MPKALPGGSIACHKLCFLHVPTECFIVGKQFLPNALLKLWLARNVRCGFICGMPSKSIFISYRREDSSGHAGRIKDRLEQEFGEACRLFMDVDAIPLGVDFVKHLTAEVANCDVLLVVVGRQWIELRDAAGERRLHQPNDNVRIEISAALQRDIPVIPILLDGTTIPRAEALPDDLKKPHRSKVSLFRFRYGNLIC
jgi:hypothetical protein